MCVSRPSHQASFCIIRLDRSTGFELPGNLPYHVKTKVIKEALEHWPHLAQQCFAITKKSLDATVRELLDKYFAPHVEGGLQAKAQ